MAQEDSEIAKLTERIARDPKSKLFVPLAEEYKKAGDLEMAQHVLAEGLKNNPGYITAKSFLGRLLMEKGDLAAARKEFEEVVKAIPDNLLAQRKLGDINALLADKAAALLHYRAALMLTPQDPDLMQLVADIEAGRSIAGRLPQPKKQQGSPSVADSRPAPALGQAAASAKPPVSAPAASHGAPAPPAEEPEEIFDLEPIITPPVAPARPSLAGPQPDFDLLPAAAVIAGADADSNGALQSSETFPDPFHASEDAGGITAALPEARDDLSTDTLAELYIAQGFFEKAIDIYERMTSEDPGNAALKRKLAEVRAMAGPGPAAAAGPAAWEQDAAGDSRRRTIARLELWLKNIMKEKRG